MTPADTLTAETAGIADAIDELAVRAAYEGEKQLFGMLASVAALMRHGLPSPLQQRVPEQWH